MHALEPSGEPVVRLVPAELVGDVADAGRLVDDEQLDPGDLREVGERLAADARHRTLWCGPPARSHASAAVVKSGFGFHTARATGSRGRSSSGSHELDLVQHEPEAVAEVEHRDDDRRGRAPP